MTTIKLFGGDFGRDSMLVRANLCEASGPVQINHRDGEGWRGTQYQTAITRHRTEGLVEVGVMLAAEELGIDEDEFECEWEEID
jgi:hypothetical protein